MNDFTIQGMNKVIFNVIQHSGKDIRGYKINNLDTNLLDYIENIEKDILDFDKKFKYKIKKAHLRAEDVKHICPSLYGDKQNQVIYALSNQLDRFHQHKINLKNIKRGNIIRENIVLADELNQIMNNYLQDEGLLNNNYHLTKFGKKMISNPSKTILTFLDNVDFKYRPASIFGYIIDPVLNNMKKLAHYKTNKVSIKSYVLNTEKYPVDYQKFYGLSVLMTLDDAHKFDKFVPERLNKYGELRIEYSRVSTFDYLLLCLGILDSMFNYFGATTTDLSDSFKLLVYQLFTVDIKADKLFVD